MTETMILPTLGICTNHNGKMKGMQSMSTSCAHNPLCKKNANIKGSICEKCYAQTMMKMYKNLDKKCETNTQLLTERVIPTRELPFINSNYFRFEAFGDIHNETHLINYVNIAKKNKHCRFALWSKNYGVLLDYFKEHKVPSNMNIIVSSLFINKEQTLSRFKELNIPTKVFTVYTKGYVKENNIGINCGAKSCATCLQCYKKNKVVAINELLKSDQKKHKEEI